jgi:glucoamylase
MPPKVKQQQQQQLQRVVQDDGPSWKVQLFLVGSLFTAAVACISITSNLERFNYITSYPSRFSLQSLPDDLVELATFLTPEPAKLLYSNAQTTYRQWTEQDVRLLSLDRFLEKEERYAWDRLLENVHPPGTAKGCVVASPSREKPDYW